MNEKLKSDIDYGVAHVAPANVGTFNDGGMPVLCDRPASEVVYTGPYGCEMHDDRHISIHYTFLHVIRGAPGWGLFSWFPKARHGNNIERFEAREDQYILLNVHQPHALTHEKGFCKDGWAAAAWDFQDKAKALKFIEKSGVQYRTQGL